MSTITVIGIPLTTILSPLLLSPSVLLAKLYRRKNTGQFAWLARVCNAVRENNVSNMVMGPSSGDAYVLVAATRANGFVRGLVFWQGRLPFHSTVFGDGHGSVKCSESGDGFFSE